MSTPDHPPAPVEPPAGDQRYLASVNRVLDTALNSRGGLGAYRHYEGLFQDTARLAWESGLLRAAVPFGGSQHPHLFMDWWHMLRSGGATRFLFRDILAHPSSYEPRALWALYWALAQAEHDFLYKFAPLWSNEERLTGHLLSQVVMQLDNFGPVWRDLAGTASSEPLCRITYIDTAAAGQEKYTGGDLGLVVHGRYSPGNEFFKAAVLQTKKADWSCGCRVDLAQADKLLQRESLGYYLLYHPYDKTCWCPTPTVHPAHLVKSDVAAAAKSTQKTVQKSMKSNGWDFAAFVTFGLADPASDIGVCAASPADVAKAVMTGCIVSKSSNDSQSSEGAVQPSRVLIITLGQGASTLDWTGPSAFGEWVKGASQG